MSKPAPVRYPEGTPAAFKRAVNKLRALIADPGVVSREDERAAHKLVNAAWDAQSRAFGEPWEEATRHWPSQLLRDVQSLSDTWHDRRMAAHSRAYMEAERAHHKEQFDRGSYANEIDALYAQRRNPRKNPSMADYLPSDSDDDIQILWFCDDCTLAVVNGDFPDNPARGKAVMRGLERLGRLGDLALDTMDDDEGTIDFAQSACDCCSVRGGRRTRFALFMEAR